MSEFSEMLREKIDRTGLPVYTLAKKAGVNRPMVHKSLKDESIPSDDFIQKLCEAMMLTAAERRQMLILAKRARMGEPLYLRRHGVANLLGSLTTDFDDADMVALKKVDENLILNKHYTFLQGAQISYMLLRVLREKLREDRPLEICFYLPETAKGLLSILYHLMVSCDKSRVRLLQFVGLEKEYNRRDSAVFNLQKLAFVLNFSLMPGLDYQAFYHYLDHPDNAQAPAMPYFITTRDAVITLTGDLATGVYYGRGGVQAHYDRVIRGMLKNGRPLVRVEANCTQREVFGDCFSIIESTPSLIPVIGTVDIEDLVRPGVEDRAHIVALAQAEYQRMRQHQDLSAAFFQISALEDFLVSGRVPAISTSLLRPLTPAERKDGMGRLRAIMEGDGQPKYYAFGAEGPVVDPDIQIVLSGEKEIIISRALSEPPWMRVVEIREPNCVNAFVDFFEYLPGSDLIISREEMLSQTDRLLKKHFGWKAV
jgi:transcriptional regulator with XRE-family HTH domain